MSSNLLHISVDGFINRLKKDFDLRTDSDVAKLLKVSRQSIFHWRKNNKVPDKYIRMYENGLLGSFTNDHQKFKLPSDAVIARAERRLLPVIGLAEAGPGIVDGSYADPDEFMSCPHGLSDPKAFWVVVTGDSMTPFLRSHQRVCVSPNVQCNSGDRCVVGLESGERLVAEVRFNGEYAKLVKYNSEDMKIHLDKIEFCYKIVYVKEQ